MKILFTTAVCCLALASCKKAETDPLPERVEADAEVVAASKECFEFIKNKDTVRLTLSQNGDNASGNLAYKWFEKDKSSGDFTGTISGDTLKADFTFQSEGTTSVREIVFLRSGNMMLQGNGNMEEKNGKTVFKNSNAVAFDKNMVLVKTECKD